MSNNYPGDNNPYGANQNGAQGGYQQNADFDQNQQGYGQPAGQGAYDQGTFGGYQSFPGDQNQMVTGANRPGAGKRLLGYIIDAIIVSIIGGIIGWIFFGSSITDYIDASANATSTSSTPDLPTGAIMGMGFVTLIIWFAYRLLMEVNTGGTVGKKAISAKVTMEDGSPVSYGASFIRNSWYILSVIPGFGSLLYFIALIVLGVTIGKNPGNQSFSDKWAKTIVTNK